MDYNPNFKQYDELLYITTVNLFTLSKDKSKIYLNHFNPLDPSHLTLFQIAHTLHIMYNWPLYIDMPLFKFFKFKTTHKDIKRGHYEGKSCNELINDIEHPNNAEGKFVEIYDAYYKNWKTLKNLLYLYCK